MSQILQVLLITKGRKTGKPHTVRLRAVLYNNKLYFSRRNPNSDWLKNAIVNPQVKVELDRRIICGNASLVKDEDLAKKISQLKYSDKRSEEPRIVLKVVLGDLTSP